MNDDATQATRTPHSVYRFAVGHDGGFESRHEAVGEAAIRNRERDDVRPDLPVWSYRECRCEHPQVMIEGTWCANCDAVIA